METSLFREIYGNYFSKMGGKYANANFTERKLVFNMHLFPN